MLLLFPTYGVLGCQSVHTIGVTNTTTMEFLSVVENVRKTMPHYPVYLRENLHLAFESGGSAS